MKHTPLYASQPGTAVPLLYNLAQNQIGAVRRRFAWHNFVSRHASKVRCSCSCTAASSCDGSENCGENHCSNHRHNDGVDHSTLSGESHCSHDPATDYAA